MLTVHHLENSQSLRILWLLEELGVPYELKMYDRDKATFLAPPELKRLSPLGTAPVITDGEVTLAESSAIVDYVLDRYGEGGLRPAPSAPERLKYLFWFHAAQGSFQLLLTVGFLFSAMKSRSPRLIRPVIRAVVDRVEAAFLKPRLKALLDAAEADLAKTTWLAGDALTAADVNMSFCMEAASARGLLGGAQRPGCTAFVARMRARPAYQRALAKDGKFTLNIG